MLRGMTTNETPTLSDYVELWWHPFDRPPGPDGPPVRLGPLAPAEAVELVRAREDVPFRRIVRF